jgi:CRISPR-associated protein Cmr4
MAVSLLFVHALTSIHPGTGQGVGTIDLPIARERATNLPVIPGSTLKGCLRAYGMLQDEARREDAFGKSDQQGKLRISDARLLLLPVRALGSTFAWVTSPYVLRRFQRDCDLLRAATPPRDIPEPGKDQAEMSDRSACLKIGEKSRLVLEDVDFEVEVTEPAKRWANWIAERLFEKNPEWRPEFAKRFGIVGDSHFDYLCEYATEVNAHIAIEGGKAKDKALWYEETLPAETVLVAVIEDGGGVAAGEVVPAVLRLGGNESTGQGLARLARAGGAL